eukprot:TRINITY_DN9417_c0_g1_i3.p1 TRINITY_DN9417_c0_g1~~TRINITY_DN9417_c0_g1_i3.p1  ORF type:complete len:331 (-),score=67.48 TRINITY_DN9417_c0_g1_i3:79-1071(-)
MAPDRVATDTIYYSWNEGLTWESFKFIESDKIEVSNIYTEGALSKQVFLVYGESFDPEKRRTGVVVSINFTTLHKETCKGIDEPGTNSSDYELWTANGKISPNCLLGHKITYTRRKRESACFNPQEGETKRLVENCMCTEEDWECDVGFTRKGDGPCERIKGRDERVVFEPPPPDCEDFYYVTAGYRKVAGDTCVGGVRHDPLKLKCPNTKILSKGNLGIIVISALVVFGVVYFLINSKLLDKFRNAFGNLKPVGGSRPRYDSLQSAPGKKGGAGSSSKGREAEFSKIVFEEDNEMGTESLADTSFDKGSAEKSRKLDDEDEFMDFNPRK